MRAPGSATQWRSRLRQLPSPTSPGAARPLFTPAREAIIASNMGESAELAREGAVAPVRLSERQRQCLTLVADGFTSKEIARQLNLSPSTVDNHLRAAMERLGLNNRADAARLLRGANAVASAPRTRDEREELPAPQASVRGRGAGMLQLPPIGGAENRMSLRRRYFHVAQIALLGTMTMTAVIMTIAGLVQLFSR